MKQATLCLLIRHEPKRQILLGLKKRGFGQGKFNGFGGKVEEGELVQDAALRELYEETEVKAKSENVTKVGELSFFFPSVQKEKGWDQVVHVFLVNEWEGEPAETEEMKPEWFHVEDIPFEKMWQDDTHWLPLILENKKVRAKFTFNEDNESIQDMFIEEINIF